MNTLLHQAITAPAALAITIPLAIGWIIVNYLRTRP